jgi:hypothetical protein
MLVQKVPGNYNWKTKGVQNKKNKKKCKKWDPLLDVLIPELFDDLQSDTWFFCYARTNIFTVNATTLYI